MTKTEKPKILYKYRSVNELSLAAVEKSRIWYSKPASLNDPTDVAARWKKDFTDREIVEDYVMHRSGGEAGNSVPEYVRGLLEKGLSYWQVLAHIDKLFLPVDGKTQRELLQDVLYYNEVMFSQMGVFSLSASPTQPLMWAHYADSHKGFCLGFEYHETNVLGQYANPMNYYKKMPKPNISNFAMDAGGEVVGLIAYSKSTDWEYEEEWRVLKQTGDELHPYPGRLVEIVLGLKISEESENTLRDAVKQSGAEPKYRKIQKNDYGLEAIDC